MSVNVIVEKSIDDHLSFYKGVVGHIIIVVIKKKDGELTIERDIAVNADSAEDNEVVEAFIKSVQAKLEEVLPKPEFVVYEETPKLWLPE